MRALSKQERRVNIDLSFCDVDPRASEGHTVMRLYQRWGKRKKQPVYELKLTPSQIQRLAIKLAAALVEHRNRAEMYMEDVREALK